MRKTFIYVLLFLFIFALNFSFFESPSYAFLSSLDSPAGAELAAYESGTVAAAGAATDTAATGTLSGAVSGQSLTATGSFAGGSSDALAVVGAGGLSLLGISAAGISSLQHLAAQKYCAANPSASVCGSETAQFTGQGLNSSYPECHLSGIFYPRNVTGHPTLSIQSTTFPSNSQFAGCPEDIVIDGFGNPTGDYFAGGTGTIVGNPNITSALPWSQWDAASRNAAVQLLAGTDYYNNSTKTSPTPFPSSMSVDPTVTTSLPGFYQNADGTWTQVGAGGACTNLTYNSNSNNNNNNGGGGSNNNTPPPTPAPSNSTSPPSPTPTPTTTAPTPTPTTTAPTPTPTQSNSSPPTTSPSPSNCDIMHPASGSDSHSGYLADGANLLISLLPSTPAAMRLPTIFANMGGQGSLAGNLALELYSTAWQYFAIIALVKFYKLIPGKMT